MSDLRASQTLEKPTQGLVEEYVTKFKNDPERVASDEALTLIFKTCSLNCKIEDVLLKASAVNQLYSTRVYATAIYALAKLICGLDVDLKLNQASLDVVDEIAYKPIGKNNRYVFATKYCHWHRPDVYPIYDTNAKELILKYQEVHGFARVNFSENDLQHYPKYKEIIEEFRCYYKLGGVTFRELDKFLWLYKA
jgi:hypothetical protein